MKYFTIAELCKSSTADKHGINNRCRFEHISNLTNLVDNVLDPLREAWGKPITVNSGFRSKELNKKIGGATNSQHMDGEAADITAGSKADNKKLFELIQSLKLPFDQIIDEGGYSWLHVSYRSGNNRGQVLHLSQL